MQPEEYRDIEKGIVQQIAGKMGERKDSDFNEIGERIERPHKDGGQ